MDIVSVGIMGNTITGLPNWIVGVVIVGVVICYSMFGGLWSVVMTDVLQFFLMTSLTLLLLPGLWTGVGGFEGLQHALPAGHFSPTGGLSVSQLLVFFLLGPGLCRSCRLSAFRSVQQCKDGKACLSDLSAHMDGL